ncbi:hypothetical protein DPMN_017701 [Dreissena polymorpha]|uniref:Uncharacterized protein n=1 Tax=Dreissena polymorpha TaxID=45954 RepID=A0A9D4NBW3_DREPO|nr:hypothetical protein DPMN_017701 [Dreissena polymorpha]
MLMVFFIPLRGRPRVDNGAICIVEIHSIVIRYVQYQFEVRRCRNEEFIVAKRQFWGAQGLAMGPCIIEIDPIAGLQRIQKNCSDPNPNPNQPYPIVISDVQYKFEVNRCRNEEVIVKGNFGWVWSMWAGRPRIDRIVIRDVQYQFEVNGCRIEEVNFQGSSAYRLTDGQTEKHSDFELVAVVVWVGE